MGPRLAALVAVAALACASQARAAAGEAEIAPAAACATLAGLSLGPGATVTRAEAVEATPALPAHCAVRGMIDPHTGPDGKPYGIEFAVNLPQRWNGRFLYQGGGGLNGVVNPPVGADAAGGSPALARGFAVASSDSGHRGAGFDRSFMADQEAVLNFAYGSVARTAPVARALVARYYGRPAHHAYFDGCSTGGREGLIAAQRYPAEFDGILVGDPAMRTGHSNLALAYAAVAFNQVAARDPASGKPIPGSAFSPADKQLVVEGVLAACDRADGLADRMVFAWRACRFEPRALQCPDAKQAGCLSPGQVHALEVAFAGPRAPSGRSIYPGYPFDTGVAVDSGPIPGFLPSARPSPLGPPNQDLTIDLDAREAAVNADSLQRLQDAAFTTNLSGFFGRGAKMVLYHGMSDPWFSALDTVGWYERVQADNPGAAQGARLFLAPGMGHCRGGPMALDRFDLLTALVDWVENGRAPERVVATGTAFPGRSRPLCAYPAYAHYRGEGESEDEGSFDCRR
jgi:feruloyl esterase